MSQEISSRLSKAPIVPLVQADKPEVAIRMAQALVGGGLSVIEVILRTEAALDAVLARTSIDIPGDEP